MPEKNEVILNVESLRQSVQVIEGKLKASIRIECSVQPSDVSQLADIAKTGSMYAVFGSKQGKLLKEK